MIKNPFQVRRSALVLALALMLSHLPQLMMGQEAYERLYSPEAVKKHKIKTMTVEFYAATAGVDSSQKINSDPDYREIYSFDAEGRPIFYEATNINIRRLGTAGPHL